MATRKTKKSVMNAGQQRETVNYLKRVGFDDKEIPKAISQIKKSISLGIHSAPEAVQGAIADWQEEQSTKYFKSLEDAYKAQIVANKKSAKAAKAAAKAAADAADSASVFTEPISAVPMDETILPSRTTKEMSGFARAMSERLKDMGEKESKIQEELLDGFRKTAEDLVRQNDSIFGSRMEKTSDQSAAYEILESIVSLGEQAARARTVEQKKKILIKLRSLKGIVNKVFSTGSAKAKEVAVKFIEMIEKIEKPLAKESGMRAAAGEKITDFMKKIPENLAAKIPLIGGLLSGALQRRREGKEAERESLAETIAATSQSGRSSLFGRGGGMISPSEAGIGSPDLSGASVGESVGGSMSASVGGSVRGSVRGSLGDSVVVQTLRSILSQVVDIKNIITSQYDPASDELKKDEAALEAENKNKGMMAALKGMFGFGKTKKDAGTEVSGGGGGGGGLGGMIASALGLAEAIPAITSVVASVGGAIATTAATVAGVAGALAPAAAIAGTAAGGAALGLGAAFAINKGIDKVFGTDLADRTFAEDTWRGTTDQQLRIETGGQIANIRAERAGKDKAITENLMEDPRNLASMVERKQISGAEALTALSAYEKQYGADEDTAFYKNKILEKMTPEERKNAVVTGAIEFPTTSNTAVGNSAMQLDRARDAAEAAAQQDSNTSSSVTSVVAPNTTNNNTTINNNTGGGTRNNDATLKSAERGAI